jgi:PKD repeat protein
MSTPTATGSGVLLQEYFANTHHGRLMRSSTLRGLFIHTADECGQNPGPDYAFGWGLINTRKAAELIRTDSLTSLILELPVANGEVYEKTFSFTAGEPVTATICWNDPAGTVGPAIVNDRTPKLVNDMDMRIVHLSSGDTLFPWKLNVEVPEAAATKGDNVLDNVERIDFTPTVGGEYKLIISHKGTLAAPQVVSLLVSGIANPAGNACRGTIQYVASQGTFNDGSAATAEYGAMSDCKWIINPVDTNTIVQLSFSRFNVQPGDTLYIRRGNSMASPLFVKLTGIQIPQNILVPGGRAFLHFITDGSVGSTGWEINYSALQLPAGTMVTQSASFCAGVQNRFSLDAGGRDTTGYRFNWSFPGGTPSSSTMAAPMVTYSEPGSFNVSLSVTNAVGAVALQNNNFVTVLPSSPMVVSGFFDGFETDSFPGYPYGGGASWRIMGTPGAGNWQRTQDAAFHGTSSLMAPNRQPSLGLRTIISPQFDYTPVQGTLKFSFRYSFARAAANNNDVLQIYTSLDCGRTWTLRRTRSAQGSGISALTTLPGVINIPGNYAPFGEGEWALDSIMLNLGNARANVMFRFDMTAGGGHPIYLDNIRFNSDLVTNLFAPASNSLATVYPNPSEGVFTLKLASEEPAMATVFDHFGKVVYEQRLTERISQMPTTLKPGVYSLQIKTGNRVEMKKITVHQ